MAIEFKSIRSEMLYLDPRRAFSENTLGLEVRLDPLTGRSGRVGHSIDWKPPADRPDHADLVRRSIEAGCPFCPDVVEKVTPLFPRDIVPEGRLRVGEAVLVPNLFPYDTHSAVCIISRQHYVGLGDFTPELIRDAILACQEYLRRVQRHDAGAVAMTLGWNYLPLSGGSLVHPHIAAVAGQIAPSAMAEQLAASHAYFERHGRAYWEDLVEAEERAGERFLGHVGQTSWLAIFAPRGWLGDFCGVVRDRASVLDLSPDDCHDLARGIARIQRYWADLHLSSFNLVLASAQPGDCWFAVNVQLVVRFSPRPAFGMSDYNWLNLLHEEGIAIVPPEDAARAARAYFGG